MNTRIKFRISLKLVLAVLALGVSTLPAQAAIKCWKNSEGVRECGNVVPPEYAQQGHETVNKAGLTIGTKGRAKTLAELEQERVAAKAEEAIAKEEMKLRQRDNVLLDTFASEDDLVLTRDGQIAHLESQVGLTKGHIGKLKNNLNQMIERAAEVEREGDAPGAEMVSNIEDVRGQIVENETFISTKRREQRDIKERFDVDIRRFLELKAGR
jgi:hypothetical protein